MSTDQHVQESLRESEIRKRAMLKAALDAIVTIDAQGTIIEFNPAAQQLFGYCEAEAVGHQVTDLIIPTAMRDLHRRGIETYFATGHGPVLDTRIETTAMRSDGSELPVELTVTPLHLKAGTFFTAYIRDITDRKEAETKAAAQIYRLRTLTHLNRIISSSLDMDKVLREITAATAPLMHVSLASIWVAHQATYSLEARAFSDEHMGADFPNRHIGFDQGGVGWVARHHLPLYVSNVLEDERFVAKNWWIKHHLYTFLGVPVMHRGNLLAVLALNGDQPIKFDFEEQELLDHFVAQAALAFHNAKHYMEVAAARDAAEAATQAKSQFLATMSHELRTPLNSIIGFSNVLFKNKRANLDKQELSYALRINNNGSHLLNLINDILDISKIESGKMEINITKISVTSLVSDVIGYFEANDNNNNIELLTIFPESDNGLETDESKFKQIIYNLIGNALKFTVNGSVTARIEVDEQTREIQRIDIIDTGVGIPKDRLELIFDSFQQADTSTSRKYGGTGLGLTISRSLAHLLGYRLEVFSEPGKGSIFSLLLKDSVPEFVSSDINQDIMESQEISIPFLRSQYLSISESHRFDKLFLIIDDDWGSCELLSHYIEDSGGHVIVSRFGEQGIKMAKYFRPDIIILDIMLPDINAKRVIKQLKQDVDLRNTPVLIVSIVASEYTSQIPEALAFFDKPVSRELLFKELEHIFLPGI